MELLRAQLERMQTMEHRKTRDSTEVIIGSTIGLEV